MILNLNTNNRVLQNSRWCLLPRALLEYMAAYQAWAGGALAPGWQAGGAPPAPGWQAGGPGGAPPAPGWLAGGPGGAPLG